MAPATQLRELNLMALGEDIIAKIGLDTGPFARGLRGARGAVADFSKDFNRSFKRIGGLIGAGGLIAGLRSIVTFAREAKEEGKEFSKQGWISPANIAVITEFQERLAAIVRTGKEFGAFTLGGIGRIARQLGAATVTGSWSKAGEVIKQMEEADKKALEAVQKAAEAAERKKKDDEEASHNMREALEEEEAIAKETQKRDEEQRKIKEDNLAIEKRLTEEYKKQSDTLKRQNQDLAITKTDRAKFTLQELAFSALRFRGRLGSEQATARQVVGLQSRAEVLRQRGFQDDALALLNRADSLRAGLSNVVDSDRFPFKSMERGIAETAKEIADLNQRAKSEGIKIVPANGE